MSQQDIDVQEEIEKVLAFPPVLSLMFKAAIDKELGYTVPPKSEIIRFIIEKLFYYYGVSADEIQINMPFIITGTLRDIVADEFTRCDTCGRMIKNDDIYTTIERGFDTYKVCSLECQRDFEEPTTPFCREENGTY